MPAAALIKLTQGATVGGDGEALFGVAAVAVNVSNAVNTGVASWEIELLSAPAGSALVPGILASSNNSATPAAAFTPTAGINGPHRLRLRVWEALNRSGDPTSTDIRVFAIKESNGLVLPAPQLWPPPLPPVASGEVGAKPDEHNFAGQANGYAGGGADGLLNTLIKAVALGSVGVVANAAALAAEPVTYVANGAIRRVETFRDFFVLAVGNPRGLVANGITYIAAADGTSIWVRMRLADPSLESESVFYWSAAGSDEADGLTAATPFQTHEEFYRRSNGLSFSASSLKINMLGAIPNQVFRIGYTANSAFYQAPLTEVGTGSLTAVTTLNKNALGGGQPWEVTDSALGASWTAGNGSITYVDKLLAARNGATTVALGWVIRDLGSRVARMGPPLAAAPLIASSTTFPAGVGGATDGTFTTGNTYSVYGLTDCAITTIKLQGQTPTWFYGLRFTATTVISNNSRVFNLSLSHCVFAASATLVGKIDDYQCLFLGSALFQELSGSKLYNPVFKGNAQIYRSKNVFIQKSAYICNGGSLEIKQGTDGGYWGEFGDIAIFDADSAGLIVRHQSQWQAGLIWGKDNPTTDPLVIVGTAHDWLITTTTPTAVSAGASNFQLGPTSYVWADLASGGVTNAKGSGLVIGAD